MRGFVYVLSTYDENVFKIGMTTRTVEQRVKEINSATGVLEPMNVVFSVEVNNAKKVEKEIHRIFDSNRINRNREFFKVSLVQIKSTLNKYSLSQSSCTTSRSNYLLNERVFTDITSRSFSGKVESENRTISFLKQNEIETTAKINSESKAEEFDEESHKIAMKKRELFLKEIEQAPDLRVQRRLEKARKR